MSCWESLLQWVLPTNAAIVAFARTAYGNEPLYDQFHPEEKDVHISDPLTAIATAEKYLRQESFRKDTDLRQPYTICECITGDKQLLKECGIGAFLYFFSLKYFAVVFMLMSFIDAYQMMLDYDGKYYAERDQSTFFPCLGNSPSMPLTNSTTLGQAQSSYRSLMRMKQMQVGFDAAYTLLFLASITVYAVWTRKIIEKHRNKNPTVADYSVKLNCVPESGICEIAGVVESHGITIHEIVPVRHVDKLLSNFHIYHMQHTVEVLKAIEPANLNRYQVCRVSQEEHLSMLKNLPKNQDILSKSHSVIIVFNTREDLAQALRLLRKSWLVLWVKKQLYALCWWRKRSLLSKINAKWIAVPMEIYWENIKQKQWFIRIFFYSMACAVILISAVIVFALRSQQNNINENTYGDLETDAQKPDLEHRLQSGAMKMLISTCIAVINVIIPCLLNKLFTTKEKHSTLPRVKLSAMMKNFVFMLINTSFIILIVNANFQDFKVYYILRMIDSRFKDLSRDWYLEVGYSITMSMFFYIFSPHVFWCIFYRLKRCTLKSVARFFDTQLALNHWVIGVDIDLAYKTAFQLVAIFGCLTYSGGMPLMLPICALILTSLLLTDSYLLRYTRRPREYSTILHVWFVKLLPGAVMLHCLFSAYGYGADSIFPHISPEDWNATRGTGFDELEYVKAVRNPYQDRATDYCGVTFIVLSGIAIALPFINNYAQLWIQRRYKTDSVPIADLLRSEVPGGTSYYIFRNIRYKEFYTGLFKEIIEIQEESPNTPVARIQPRQVFIDDMNEIYVEWNSELEGLNPPNRIRGAYSR